VQDRLFESDFDREMKEMMEIKENINVSNLEL
jgi:hypothetical protein